MKIHGFFISNWESSHHLTFISITVFNLFNATPYLLTMCCHLIGGVLPHSLKGIRRSETNVVQDKLSSAFNAIISWGQSRHHSICDSGILCGVLWKSEFTREKWITPCVTLREGDFVETKRRWLPLPNWSRDSSCSELQSGVRCLGLQPTAQQYTQSKVL